MTLRKHGVRSEMNRHPKKRVRRSRRAQFSNSRTSDAQTALSVVSFQHNRWPCDCADEVPFDEPLSILMFGAC
jgi:hypothetical protein